MYFLTMPNSPQSSRFGLRGPAQRRPFLVRSNNVRRKRTLRGWWDNWSQMLIGAINSASYSNGTITISGWAIDPNGGSPSSVAIFVDGQPAGNAAVGDPFDVSGTISGGGYPPQLKAQASTYTNAGWHAQVPASSFSPGAHNITAIGTAKDGSGINIQGSQTITIPPQPGQSQGQVNVPPQVRMPTRQHSQNWQSQSWQNQHGQAPDQFTSWVMGNNTPANVLERQQAQQVSQSQQTPQPGSSSTGTNWMGLVSQYWWVGALGLGAWWFMGRHR